MSNNCIISKNANYESFVKAITNVLYVSESSMQ